MKTKPNQAVNWTASTLPRTLMGEFTEVQDAMKLALEQLGLLAW